MKQGPWIIFLLALAGPGWLGAASVEFCIDGEFNLGARYQGSVPGEDEFTPTRWCMVTEDDSQRVQFAVEGRSNPDIEGGWTVQALPPDQVRIVNPAGEPDIVFQGADAGTDAQHLRRLDPRRLAESLQQGAPEGLQVELQNGHVAGVRTEADMPLRGRVPVTWRWDWTDLDAPRLVISVDGVTMYRGTGRWKTLTEAEAAALWTPAPGQEQISVAGENWPSRVNPRMQELGDGAWLVRGVRTGFQHLVLETEAGLVVADAPAGWVELHQLPPTDLVPGLGVSGLSERLVDVLAEAFPGRPIRAVALTHAHDDHSGGARAFAAASADVYAPAAHAAMLEQALNRPTMPDDRLGPEARVRVRPVGGELLLGDKENPVWLLSTGPGPHVNAALAVYAPARKLLFVSDLHVPSSDAAAPSAARATTECWFAAWAVSKLPDDVLVLNSHSASQTPVSRLRDYLRSDACRA